MRGSTIFWIAVGVVTYAYCWFYTLRMEDEYAREGITIVLAGLGSAYLAIDLVAFSDDEIIGPAGLTLKLIAKFNRFLDKHIG